MPTNFSRPAGASPGRVPQPPRAMKRALNLPTTAPWWYKFHPARWMVVDGEVLPILGKLKGDPGVAGTNSYGDTTLAKAYSDRRGWMVIPWDVLGDEDDPYIRVHDVRGGVAYLSKWQRPKQIGNRVVTVVDEAGYLDFLRLLMSRGIVPPPDPDLLDALTDIQRARMERVRAQAAERPSKLPAAEREAARLAETEAAITALRGEA